MLRPRARVRSVVGIRCDDDYCCPERSPWWDIAAAVLPVGLAALWEAHLKAQKAEQKEIKKLRARLAELEKPAAKEDE